ncbi:unnamed protein product [Cylicostephanus goldi]|uniref:PABS domain-containing protein n=1 Tax=Cylicostephanus goldi TaxID=71465 RepID=A0A3P6SAZ2_CYLGO|nr:unnamed protein product [Cylicostephanus goldi]
MVEDDHHKVVVADGVAYVAGKARAGALYDAILIDACRSEHPGDINCPLEVFYSNQVLNDAAKLLTPGGMLFSGGQRQWDSLTQHKF